MRIRVLHLLSKYTGLRKYNCLPGVMESFQSLKDSRESYEVWIYFTVEFRSLATLRSFQCCRYRMVSDSCASDGFRSVPQSLLCPLLMDRYVRSALACHCEMPCKVSSSKFPRGTAAAQKFQA